MAIVVLSVVIFLLDNQRGKKSVPLTKWSVTACFSWFLLLFLIFTQEYFLLLILGREKQGEREGQRERDRNIDQRPPACAPMGDETHNLGIGNQTRSILVHRTMFQPTEPPGQGRHCM